MTETFLHRGRRIAREAADRWWGPGHPGAAPHAAAGARRHDIHRRWRAAVREIGLSERVYLPGGVHRVEPRIARVVLGRPERFTVRLGAGQTFDDLTAVGKAIARAFDADRIRVTELADDLVEIELLSDAVAPTSMRRPGAAPAAA
ncbi:hypothetical protein ACFPK1_22590 [Actinomycetospora rhizophila]|uniref:Uncharacterized protein n=1 Tax=Actinomycetospora rhizophila TaxID=1416876 RepID=A0ABV9ZHM4_9PSEU